MKKMVGYSETQPIWVSVSERYKIWHFGVILAYRTTACFQWGLLKNNPYTYTVNEDNCRVFENLTIVSLENIS